tara:strand:+ start:1914 stop:2081 length:168 start_codon:yes stop_codon:yes gene_type:complete
MTIEVSKAEFDRYVKVQESGMVNMISPDVQDLADISKDVHMAIMQNYVELSDKYK